MPSSLYTVLVTYANGSQDQVRFRTYMAVRDFYRKGISYSGDRVHRVEVDMFAGGLRAIWDINWNAESKSAGLLS